MDFTLSLSAEICAELGVRARAARLRSNVSTQDMAQRIGLSTQTLSHFERSGKCTLNNFVRILEALGASGDLQGVLDRPVRSIEAMQTQLTFAQRQRAYKVGTQRASTRTSKRAQLDHAP